MHTPPHQAMLFALPTVVTGLVAMSAGGAPKMAVMINGLPGAMGREIASACLRRGVELVPFGLTGPDCGGELSVDDGSGGSPVTVKMYESDGADEVAARLAADYPHAVCIDFTLPMAVNPNSEWYAKHGLPFVMGTTGGDREALMACVEKANVYCVIAPNMAKQIVALQVRLTLTLAPSPSPGPGPSPSPIPPRRRSRAWAPTSPAPSTGTRWRCKSRTSRPRRTPRARPRRSAQTSRSSPAPPSPTRRSRRCALSSSCA